VSATPLGGVQLPMLEVAGLTRRFGGLVAVDDVSLRVAEGEIVGLLGPNGSGKTTVLNLISGALRPDAGVIRLGGTPIHGLPSFRIARLGVARTFQLVRVLASMTCRENVLAGIAFGAHAQWGAGARRAADTLLGRVGLGERPAALPRPLRRGLAAGMGELDAELDLGHPGPRPFDDGF